MTVMGDTRDITVEVSLKPHDVYTPFQWDLYNLGRWVTAAVLCWIFYDLYKNGLDALRSFPDSGSIIAILAVLASFILVALLLFPYLRVRAMFRNSPQLRETVNYTFSSEGMRFDSKDSSGSCKWSGFDRILETRKVFAFSVTSQAATYVPKRCFVPRNDIAALRQLVRDNFKGKWRLRTD
jgi:hypothetical protein